VLTCLHWQGSGVLLVGRPSGERPSRGRTPK
jgi:hypothetical protein